MLSAAAMSSTPRPSSHIRGSQVSLTQREVLSHTEADTWDLEKLLKYVEGKESGLASQGLMSGSGNMNVVKPGGQR